MVVVERHRTSIAAQPRVDDLPRMPPRLLGRIADAGDRPGQHRRIADREDLRVARHAEVVPDLYPAGLVCLDAQPFRRRRGQHPGRPDHRVRLDRTVSCVDTIRMHRGDRCPQPHVDAELLECALCVVRHLGLEVGKHPRAGFDQHHARIFGTEIAEVAAQRDARQLDHRAGKLHAGRAAANNDESQQVLPPRRIGLELGLLERHQEPAAHRRRIFQRLEPGCIGLPVAVSEIGVPRAGSENQIVVRDLGAVGERHLFLVAIDGHDVTHQRAHVVPLVDEVADRPGDLGRRQRRGRHLVEQRLEQMVIALVDQRDVAARAFERLDGREAAKAPADNHDLRFVLHGRATPFAPFRT